MAEANNQNSETLKKPSLSESVDSLIQKKKSESSQESENVVRQSAENTQSEVADIMSGVEKPSESLGKAKERKGDGDLKTSTAQSDDDAAATIQQGLQSAQLPTETVMVQKVRTAIKLQIKMEWKKAKRLRKNLATGGAQEYTASISRIRKLKQTLASLFTATFEYVKDLYLKYFNTDGRRRTLDDMSSES